jgi:pimeloyl-ACP methyl ester carboxylesterase
MTTISPVVRPRFNRTKKHAMQTLRRLVYFLFAALVAFLLFRNQPAQADGSFYEPDAQSLKGTPGSVIRSEPMPFSPPGANAFRILYRSIGLHGEPIPVSGVLIVPADGGDDGSRKIVAWAHPTTGVASVCAPSLSRVVYRQIQGLRQMLSKGYAVVATDYPGLGAPGVHPYLIGDSEGRSVLDSVRAAHWLLGQHKPSEFAVWGHSQGGQAALYTGLLAGSYAPDLRLVGVAAAAPATDLPTLISDDFASSGGKGLTALALWSWSRVFDIGLGAVVEPQAMPTVDTLARGCIETIFDLLERRPEERPLNRHFLDIADISKAQPWNDLMRANSPGIIPKEYPVLIAQGLTDGIVRPQVTFDYARQLCERGDRVELDILPNVGHGFIARDSANDVVEWISDRFDGKAVPSSCDHIPTLPAGPVPEGE